MTVTARRQLQPLQHLAEQDEQAALKRMAQAQDGLVRARARLTELQGYLQHYVREAHHVGPVRVTQITNQRNFIDRLRAAIDLQRRNVATVKATLEQKRALWLLARQKRRSLDELQARRQRVEQRDEQRREQRQMDEIATRRTTPY